MVLVWPQKAHVKDLSLVYSPPLAMVCVQRALLTCLSDAEDCNNIPPSITLPYMSVLHLLSAQSCLSRL